MCLLKRTAISIAPAIAEGLPPKSAVNDRARRLTVGLWGGQSPSWDVLATGCGYITKRRAAHAETVVKVLPG
jgi:hypothetical protein